MNAEQRCRQRAGCGADPGAAPTRPPAGARDTLVSRADNCGMSATGLRRARSLLSDPAGNRSVWPRLLPSLRPVATLSAGRRERHHRLGKAQGLLALRPGYLGV